MTGTILVYTSLITTRGKRRRKLNPEITKYFSTGSFEVSPNSFKYTFLKGNIKSDKQAAAIPH
jgi:hypothetical protein